MDESGKNLMSDPKHNIFIYGGLIIDKENVENSLYKFKEVYQEARAYLQGEMRNKFEGEGSDKSNAMRQVFNSFEFHAVEIFNNRHRIKRSKIVAYNPWVYADVSQKFNYVRDLLEAISPYITKVFIYKVEKNLLKNFQKENGITIDDDYVDREMIKYIIKEYDKWLIKENTKGALLPDMLDSDIREKFVEEINLYKSNHIWPEPIIIDSSTNAFTQIIDIITYCYYMISQDLQHKDNFKAIQRLYHQKMEKHIEVKDLGLYLDTLINQ